MPRFVGIDGYKHHWEHHERDHNQGDYFIIAFVVARYNKEVIDKYFHHRISEKHNTYILINFLSRQEFYNTDAGQKTLQEITGSMNYLQKIHQVKQRILDSI